MAKTTDWTPCPVCHQMSGLALAVSVVSDQNYFECEACGHFWKTPKKSPRSP